MTDFLDELQDLFFRKQISGVLNDFEKSSFFKEHYLTQTFQKIVKNTNGEKVEIQPSRFKKKSFFLKNNYPIQLNQELTDKLKKGEEIKVVNDNDKDYNVDSKINNLKKNKLNKYSTNLQVSNITLQETKELKMFINGSNQNPEQFETWSAEKMYRKWLLLRLSNIPKPDWPIREYVFFLFINQISCILNSYILYGNINDELEVEAYKSYLKELDEFLENGGLYKELLNLHLLFCRWYDSRIKYDPRKSKKRLVKINDKDDNKLSDLFKKSKKQIVAYRHVTHNNIKNTLRMGQDFFGYVEEQIKPLFEYTLSSTNYSMLIFTSYFQKVEKFNRLYASPIFPILGIPFKTHNGKFYSAIRQVLHDYLHLTALINYFEYLYQKKNLNTEIDDTKIFFEKMLFLMKLDETEKSNNAKYLLWWILHENHFLYVIKLNENDNSNKRFKSFFDITTLKSILEKLKTIIGKGETNTSIYISSSNENYSTVLSCINLLIQVCDETLDDSNKNKLFKKIINETIQSYNRNNLNNSKAVYGDNNNFRKSVKTPRFNSITRNTFNNITLGNRTGSLINPNYFSNQNPNNT